MRTSRSSTSSLQRALAAVEDGDCLAALGDRAGALMSYGAALDTYLAERLPVLAAGVAQRMIARYPDVVRARLTLAVLSLAEGLRVLSPAVVRSARPDFEAYVSAARAAGEEGLAVRQLLEFAEATESVSVREQIAELLHLLDEPDSAERIYVAAYEEREGIRPVRALPGEQPGRWFDLLLAS